MTFCETPNYSRSYGENCAETEDAAFEDVVNVSEVNDQLSEVEKLAEPREPRIIGIIPDLHDPSETSVEKLTTTKKILKQTTFFAVAFSLGVTSAFLCKGNSVGGDQAVAETKNYVSVEESNKVANSESEKTNAPAAPSFSPYDNAYEPEITASAFSQLDESGSYSDYDRIDFSAPSPTDRFDSNDLDAWAALGDMLQSTESDAYDDGVSYDNPRRVAQSDVSPSYQQGVSGGFADYSFGSDPESASLEGNVNLAPTVSYQDERLASNRLSSSTAKQNFSLNTDYPNSNDDAHIGFSENNANFGAFSRKWNYNEDYNRDDSRGIASQRRLDLDYATNMDQGRSRFQGFETRTSEFAQNDSASAERQPSAYVAQRVEEETNLPLQGSASSRSVRW
ncbi:MAG: hypothetical protein ACI4NP_06395 [Thermoguttaceae bacterium]